jgi:hypothetical protein
MPHLPTISRALLVALVAGCIGRSTPASVPARATGEPARHALPLAAPAPARLAVPTAGPPTRLEAPTAEAPTAEPPTDDTWAQLQRYLPALRGRGPLIEFEKIGAYAAEPEATAHWRQLAASLAAGGGGLGATCAGVVPHFLALLVADPVQTSSIGRPDPDVRVFWVPLARVARMTIRDVIRAAGLVDGLEAARQVRGLRARHGGAAWIAAVDDSSAWFLPAGDEPSIHPRRVRGYAVASTDRLRAHLVHIGTNVLADTCEVATVAFPVGPGIIGGPIRDGSAVVCDLPGVGALPECAP